MAVTSSFSSELVAHASIVTYDLYRPCKLIPHLRTFLTEIDINPKATDQQLKMVSHASLTFFALFSSSFATALNVSTIKVRFCHACLTNIVLRHLNGLDPRIHWRNRIFRRSPNNPNAHKRTCLTNVRNYSSSNRHRSRNNGMARHSNIPLRSRHYRHDL